MSWLSLLAFFLEEALVNLRRHGLVTIATVTTIAVTIGVWVLFSLEARAWEKFLVWEGQKLERLCVFLKPDADKKTAEKLAEQIQKLPYVVQVKFVHKDEGLEKLQRMFGNSVPLEDLVGHNPLPHALEVTCTSPQETVECAAKIKQMPMVDEVTFPAIAVQRYVQIVRSIRWRNHALSILLAIIAFILIFNALRVSVYGRRNEIRIMQLVGATVWTVRGPLLMEGLLYGVLGGLGTLVLAKLLLALNAAFPQETTCWTGLLGSWVEWRMLLNDIQIDSVFVSQVLLLSMGLSFLSAIIAAVRLVRAV
ncbi:MAG: ABC transporter permease [Armatimonadetes bacterium]|nr:ABC transporter permease [Armatimonadota bacterium]MCX7967123.1 ABC transporter permease [Armatimonadota bacterium]MDW8142700.1 permease-like cell division protein FtsX [Armatimonadota bacterium]